MPGNLSFDFESRGSWKTDDRTTMRLANAVCPTPAVSEEEDHKRRSLIIDLERHARLAVAWSRHGSRGREVYLQSRLLNRLDAAAHTAFYLAAGLDPSCSKLPHRSPPFTTRLQI